MWYKVKGVDGLLFMLIELVFIFYCSIEFLGWMNGKFYWIYY